MIRVLELLVLALALGPVVLAICLLVAGALQQALQEPSSQQVARIRRRIATSRDFAHVREALEAHHWRETEVWE